MKAVLCIVFLIYFLHSNIDIGSALKCYSCTATTGTTNYCEINVNNRTVVTANCSSGYNTCMTLEINRTITRACAVTNVCSILQNSTGFRRCSICTADLCNNKY